VFVFYKPEEIRLEKSITGDTRLRFSKVAEDDLSKLKIGER
jgi:hypothetical protein